MSSSETGGPKTTRRSLLKWTGALAGAAVVGAVTGFGADVLVRPNTMTTTTVTSTTSPPPPATISYKPPLSAGVQQTVNTIVQNLVDRHKGETVYYTTNAVTIRARAKNGVISTFEEEDLINPGIPREDAAVTTTDFVNGMVQGRGLPHNQQNRTFLYSPGRVLYPMKRVGGARGDLHSSFVRITWDEALDTISAKMLAVTTKYGQYSIDKNPLLSWMGGVTGWENPSWPAERTAQELMYGAYQSSDPVAGAFNAKLVVIWSENPVQATGGQYGRGYLYRVLKEKTGVPIIVIDPKFTMSVQTLADQWIPIRPGTDLAFALAAANVIFKENLTDLDYINKYVETDGFNKWKDYVLGVTAGPDGKVDRTPEWAETICGVPAETIRAFARLYASSKPAYITAGYSKASKMPGGSNIAKSMMALATITGNVGKLGGGDGFHTNTGFSGGPVAVTAPRIDIGVSSGTFTLPLAPSGERALYFNTNAGGTLILNREKFDKGQISAKEYCNRIGNLPSNPLPNVKMAFLTREINQFNNSNDDMLAISKLDYAVCVTEHTMRPAARIADMILPTTTYGEGDPSFGVVRNVVYYDPGISTLQGEVRPTTWIYLQLAKRLGYGDKYSSKLVNVTWDQWGTNMQTLAQQAYETWAAQTSVKTMLGATPPTWDEFKKTSFIKFPVPTGAVPVAYAWKDQIVSGTAFPTATKVQNGGAYQCNGSGKIEIYSNWLATTDMTQTWFGSPIPPMPTWIPMWNSYWTKDEFNTYPLFMVTGHPMYRMHDQNDANPNTGDVGTYLTDPIHSGDCYTPTIRISPTDAKLRGIVDGDLVKVFSDAGEVLVEARVLPSIMPGVVDLIEGRWIDINADGQDTRGCANSLTYSGGIGEDKGTGYKVSANASWVGHGPVEVRKVR